MKKLKKNKERKKGATTIRFPASLLVPVANLLKGNLNKLKKRKKNIEKEDPFENSARTNDNASPDADAEEQFGHASASAIKEQLDRKMIQTKKALARIRVGKYGVCEDCSKMIDTDRLMIYPEATLCVSCEKKREK